MFIVFSIQKSFGKRRVNRTHTSKRESNFTNTVRLFLQDYFQTTKTFVISLSYESFHYTLFLSYHSNTESFCLYVFCQAGPPRVGSLLGFKDTATCYRIRSWTKVSQYSDYKPGALPTELSRRWTRRSTYGATPPLFVMLIHPVTANNAQYKFFVRFLLYNDFAFLFQFT